MAVPKTIVFADNYPEGRILSVIISPFVVLLVSNITLLPIYSFFKKRRIFNLETTCLIVAALFIILSASQSIYFPTYSVIYSLDWLGLISLVIFVSTGFNSIKKKHQQNMLVTLFLNVSLTLIFISIIAGAQSIKRAPLGITIEATSIAPMFGQGADESNLFFRPLGLAYHANIMANELLVIWLSSLIIYFQISKKHQLKKIVKHALIIVTIVFFITIVLSQSRAIYLALLFFSFNILIWKHQYLHTLILFIWSKFKKTIFINMSFLLIVASVFLQRIYLSLNSFNETGGFFIRERLNQEAMSLFTKHPFLGVGCGMFIPALAGNNPTGVVSEFPEAVHNGFLLFIVENGLVAQIIVIIFLFLMIKKVIHNKKSFDRNRLIIVGLVTQLIPMFFHPFVNYLSLYTIIVVIINSSKME